MFKTPLSLLLVFLCIYVGSSQDLIKRTLLNIPADISYSPNVIADQIYHKNDLKSINLFSLSQEKSTKLDGVELNIDKKSIEALHTKNDYVISVPVSEQQSINLKIYPSDITSAGYRLYDGERNEMKSSRVSFYRGVVADDPQSMVQLTVTDQDLRAIIIDAQGIYNLGPLADKEDYILFNDQELGEMPFECGTGSGEKIQLEDFPKMDGIGLEKSGQCVKIHIEVDHRSYQNFGQDAQAAEQFALASFAQVAVLFEYLYENAPNSIPIEISSVRIWTSPDTYGAASNVGGALPILAQAVNPASFDADLVHLISAENRNSFGGIAYVSCRGSGPCKATTIGTNVPFAVSQTSMTYSGVPNYSWTVNVLAHEMGHNMGAPHTQACVWGSNDDTAIDGCFTIEGGCVDPGYPSGPGSIMSYCHFAGRPGISFDLAFGAEVGDHLYDEYLFAAQNYLTNCGPSTQPPPVVFCETALSLSEDIVVDFESSDLSIWSNAVDDDLDWIFNSGSTPSSNTGPDQANDGSSYYYVEASSPNFPAKTARLMSECIDLSQMSDPVLSFLFHMYGESMGSLALTIHQAESSTLLATIAGDQGNQWFTATVDLRDYQEETIQIEILAETGSNWTSDIAIDRLEIRSNLPPPAEEDTCDDPLATNFGEIGLCNYACDDVPTSVITSDNANSNIISNSSISTVIPGPIEVNALERVYWRVNGTVELNQGFSIAAGSEIAIEVGSCAE